MQTQTATASAKSNGAHKPSTASVTPAKRGRPFSTGPTVKSLREDVKAAGGWVRGKGCSKMLKQQLIDYLAELRAPKF